MTAPTSLMLVADIAGTPLPELAALNPSVLKGMVPDNYSLHVPRGTGNEIMAALQLVPVERRASWRIHRVGAGETLAVIGKLYGTTQASIVSANSLGSNEAVEGDRLLIPALQRMEPSAKRPAAHSAAARTSVRNRKPAPKVKPKAPVILARVSSR